MCGGGTRGIPAIRCARAQGRAFSCSVAERGSWCSSSAVQCSAVHCSACQPCSDNAPFFLRPSGLISHRFRVYALAFPTLSCNCEAGAHAMTLFCSFRPTCMLQTLLSFASTQISFSPTLITKKNPEPSHKVTQPWDLHSACFSARFCDT